MNVSVKLCINCIHIRQELSAFPKCARQPLPDSVDLVTGEIIESDLTYCRVARNPLNNDFGQCGPSGNLFEPK